MEYFYIAEAVLSYRSNSRNCVFEYDLVHSLKSDVRNHFYGSVLMFFFLFLESIKKMDVRKNIRTKFSHETNIPAK